MKYERHQCSSVTQTVLHVSANRFQTKRLFMLLGWRLAIRLEAIAIRLEAITG